MNKRKTGSEYESRAAGYLDEKGVAILCRNFRSKSGEIDLIGRDDGYLVFFEVKYRGGSSAGSASEAVNRNKQKRICRAADYYLMINGVPLDSPIRFDVVAIDGNEISWIRNAFQYIERGRSF